ncbi:MAG: hypothetical protein ACLGIR_06500, partial [Actinomycetes bacterium]
ETMLSAFRIDDAGLRSRVAASIRHVHLTGGVGPAFEDTPPRLAIDGVRDEATAMLVDTGVVLDGQPLRLLTVAAELPTQLLLSDAILLNEAVLREQLGGLIGHLDGRFDLGDLPVLDPDLLPELGRACPGSGIDDGRVADLLEAARGDAVLDASWIRDRLPHLLDPELRRVLDLPLDGDGPVLRRPDDGHTDPPPVDDFLLGETRRRSHDTTRIGIRLAEARDLLAAGDATGLEILTELDDPRRTTTRRDPVEAYQLAVGPALLTGMAPAGMVDTETRMRALTHVATTAVPGTLAADTAARALLATNRTAARRARGREATATSGPEKRRWRAARLRAASNVLVGMPTSKTRTLVTAGQALLPAYDVARAVTSAFTLGRHAGTLRLEVGGTRTATFVPDGAVGWFVGEGAASRILDPQLRFDALDAFRDALDAGCHVRPALGLPGDLWRYDWLLDEARQAASGAISVEQLLTQLLQIVADLDLVGLAAGAELLDEVRGVVADKLAAVTATIDEIQALVLPLLDQIREATVAAALLTYLSTWPHEHWWRVASAAVSALFDGDNVGDAIADAMFGPLQDEIDRLLDLAYQTATAEVDAITAELRGALLPTHLITSLRDRLDVIPGVGALRTVASGTPASDVVDPATAGADVVDELLWPLVQAVQAIDLRAPLDAAFDVASRLPRVIPDWVRAIVIAYFAVPFAALILSGVGLFVLLIGVEYVIALLGSAFRELSGRVDELLATAERTRARIRALADGLVSELTDVALLQAALDLAGDILDGLEELFPGQLQDLARRTLMEARDTILRQVHGLSQAMERSMFREHLELVELVPDTGFTLPDLAIPDRPGAQVRDLPFLGMADPNFTGSAQALAALARAEAELVRRVQTPLQELTHVLSLRQLVPPGALDLLLQGLPVDVEIRPETIARFAPGLERLLVKDITVHVDLDTPDEVLRAVQVLGGNAAAAGGGVVDPALDGRVPGGGFPGLPVVAGRQPTGLPLVITQPGRTFVRLRPSASLLAAFTDACGCGRHVAQRPQLAGAALHDEEVAPGGWRMLELNDAPQTLMLSHFDVLEDGLRFTRREEKRTKPFEHRGLIGTWRLQVPALANGNVVPDLPPVRDVRLIVSTIGNHDATLATHDRVAPITVTEPDPVAEADGLLPDLGIPGVPDLSALLGRLDDLVAAVGGLPGQLAATLGAIDLAAATAGLADVVGDLRDATLDLSGSSAGLRAATQTALSALVATAGALDRTVAVVPLEGPVGAVTGAASGTVGATFDAADVATAATDAGIDLGSIGDVAQAVVVPVLGAGAGGLLGSTITWAGTGTVRFSPADGSTPQEATFPIEQGTSLVDLTSWTGAAAGAGTWAVELAGTGLAISSVLLGLVAPRTP